MKRKTVKVFSVFAFALIIMSALSVQTLALFTSAGDYEPISTTSYVFVYSDEYNRKINVSCVDESGALIKKVVIYTKYGEDNSFHIGIYGHDIVRFESNQGLWETCKIIWTSGTGLCDMADIFVDYYFRTTLSKGELDVTVTLRKSEEITLTVRHYTQNAVLINGYRYSLHSSDSKTIDYYDYVSTSSKSITGYDLKEGYMPTLSGNLSYTWVGKYKNTPSSPRTYSYNFVNTPWSEDMGSYSKYDEAKDGKMDYCINRVFYIDYYYDLKQYTVDFNANGGSVPSSITKLYGTSVTIPTTIPARAGYTFKGWSNTSGGSVSYSPGAAYTANQSRTLYAVWEKDNYEFSVSNLTLSETEVQKYGRVTVQVRCDNWDKNNPYTNIPAELFYDGNLISTQNVNFTAYGIAYLTFEIYVGADTGEHTVSVRINEPGRNKESNPNNNTVTASLTVKEHDYELSAEALIPENVYTAGNEVITSFIIRNDGDKDITPADNNTASFTAYYLENGVKTVISSGKIYNVVIPKNGANLIYFKWTVPANANSKTVFCEVFINSDLNLSEPDMSNNTAVFEYVISSPYRSQTPNTSFESKPPQGYYKANPPQETSGTATWSEWKYEDGEFVKKVYALQISADVPVTYPSDTCKSAVYENGRYIIKSGYGVKMSFSPQIMTVSGYDVATQDCYTEVQNASAFFPEYMYGGEAGSFRTLEKDGDNFLFEVNTYSEGGERVHFIPVYIEDGSYIICVTASEVWTPAGMIYAVINSGAVEISGTIYDDYYIGG